MHPITRAAMAAVFAVAAATSCNHRKSSADSCSIGSEISVAVGSRPDGIYAVQGSDVGETPLLRFEDMTRTDRGVDGTSGKPWVRLHLDSAAQRAIEDFTRVVEGRSIVVVVGGEVAAHHKIRSSISGSDLQVSCCNPQACARWIERLAEAPP